MKLWDKFKAITKAPTSSSSDLKAARAEFLTDRQRLVTDLDAGNGQKAEILRTGGPEGLKAHQDKLRGISDEIEARDIAITEIDRQIATAEKAEADAIFDERAAKATKAMAEIAKTRALFFEQVDALIATMEQGAELMTKVRSFNAEAATSGRADRKIPDSEMAEMVEAGRPPMGYAHPITDQVLAARLNAASQFRGLQQKLKSAA